MSDVTVATPGDDSPFDRIKLLGDRWSARELMPMLGYDKWQNFEAVVDRAQASAANQGMNVADLFTGVSKNSGGRPQQDFHLSRFACYLVAMNGDPRKPEVAAAQAYFALKTREAEIRPALPDLSTADGVLVMAEMFRQTAQQLVSEHHARVEAENHAQTLAAPARAWSHLAESSGDYEVADSAKILSRDPKITIGRDRLFAFMSSIGWCSRDRFTGRWKAYQTQVDCGRLVEKMGRPYLHEATGEMRNPPPTVRITAKGLAELHKRLGGTDGPSSLAAVS